MFLEGAVWRVDAGSVSADGLSLIDLSGNGRHAVFGTTTAKPIVLPYTGEAYWYCPPVAGNNYAFAAVLPGAATRVDFTGDFQVLNWSQDGGIQLLSGDGSAGGVLLINSSVRLYFGNVNVIVPGLTVSVGRHSLTVTLTPTDWSCSLDGATALTGTWTAGSLTAPGYVTVGNGQPNIATAVQIYSVSIAYNGAPVGYKFNPKNVSADYTTITNTGTVGGSWLISRAASGYKAAVVDRPIVLFSQDSLSTVSYSVPATCTFVIVWRTFGVAKPSHNYPVWWTDAATGMMLYRGADGTTAPWYIYPGGASTASTGLADGQFSSAMSFHGPTKTFKGYLNGNLVSTSNPAQALGTFTPLRLMYQTNGELLSAAVFDRALTDVEVALVSNEMKGLGNQQYPTVSDWEKQKLYASVSGALPSDTLADLRIKKLKTAVPSTYNKNLLLPNQANAGEDGTNIGWSMDLPGYGVDTDYGRKVVTSTAREGTHSIEVKKGAGTDGWIVLTDRVALPSPLPDTLTFVASERFSAAFAGSVAVLYSDSTGTPVGGYKFGPSVAVAANTWTDLPAYTMSAASIPAGAVWVQVGAAFPFNPGIGALAYIDRVGMWEGSDSTWSMPGEGGLITVSDLEKKYLEGDITNELPTDTLYDLRRKSYLKATSSSGQNLTTDDLKFLKEGGRVSTAPPSNPMTWVGVSGTYQSITAAYTLNLPAGTQVGDLAVLIASSDAGTDPSFTTPAGWTFVGKTAATGMFSYIWSKVLGAGETTSISMPNTGPVTTCVGVWRNVTLGLTGTFGIRSGAIFTVTAPDISWSGERIHLFADRSIASSAGEVDALPTALTYGTARGFYTGNVTLSASSNIPAVYFCDSAAGQSGANTATLVDSSGNAWGLQLGLTKV